MPFQGKIDQDGYTPPLAVIVHWSNGAQKPLDTSKDFAGWHDSDIPRYGGGDQSLASHHPSAVGVENRGGEADRILKKLFETNGGPDRDPTPREVSDFAVVHGGKRILGTGDWPTLAGVESPVSQPVLGTIELPIPFHDPSLGNGVIRRVDGKVYMNDLQDKSLPPLPASTKPIDPPRPPIVPPPPVSPPPPNRQGRQIDIDFSKAEVIQIPAGATSVLFTGTLDLPATIPGGIKPLIKTAIGPRDGERVNAGLFKITRDQTWGLEWDPDETRPLGGGKAKSGDITYEWTPGKVSVKIGDRPVRVTETLSAPAVTGGVIVFGIDPPKPGSDKPAEYVRLLGGRLRGTLTITGGTAAGPVNPPADSPPPAVGNLLAFAKEGQADAAQNLGRWTALVNLLETMKP